MSPGAALSASERNALELALALAESAIGLTDPNPRVGCVLLSPSGEVLGAGHTQAAGGAHAEVMALAEARGKGLATRGSTAVVTLEPCSHHGRTAPCCEALLAAGVARVVVAIEDPNPLVAGQGLAGLRQAGVEVVMAGEPFAERARELNIGFFSRMQRGLPFVRMKIAASLDGRTALPNGRSQWITGEPARIDGQAFRRRAGAVLTGIGTVKDDDPRLDVRLVPTAKQPLRVLVDSRLEVSRQARILQPPGEVLLVHAQASNRSNGSSAEQLSLPGEQGKVDLSALMAALGRRGVNELHVEAGHKLNGSLLAADLVDELLLYQAPVLLGEGRGLASLPVLNDLTDARRWRRVECAPVGEDLRLRFRRA